MSSPKNHSLGEIEKKLLSFSLFEFFKKNSKIFLLLAFLVFATYLNGLFNDFTSDDHGIFIFNYSLNNIFPNLSSLISNYPLLLYRKFLLATILPHPFFFRFPNLLFHLGNTWLVYTIISLLKNPKTAFFASSLFAVHPILIESVTWISGGPYAQYTFFFLLSFLFYLLSSENKKFYYFSILSFYLSLCAAEKALALFFIFPLFEICFGNLKKNLIKLLPFFLLNLLKSLILLPAVSLRQAYLQTQYYQEKVFLNPLIQIPIALSSYLELIFYPDKLTLYHSELFFTPIEFIIRALIIFIYLVAAIWCYFKNKSLFFWLCFFPISLLITLNPWGLNWIVAERYVYPGSLGIFAILGYLFFKLSFFRKYQTFVYLIFFLIISLLSLRTIIRNFDWKNDDQLWLAAARTSPHSPQNHNNLGDYFGRHGDFEKAILEFKTAIKLKPNYADAYHNLANAYQQKGDFNLAIKNYQKAISINPNLWQSFYNLALIYLNQKNYQKSYEFMQKTYIINPDPKIKENLEKIKNLFENRH